MDKVAKEILIFLAWFLFLSLGMHMQQWVRVPIEHFHKLSGSKFGFFHPFYFTLFVYFIFYILRAIAEFTKSIFSKSRD